MNYEQLVDRLHSEAMRDIKAMAASAMEELNRRIAFMNRSLGQRKRYAKGKK